MSQHLKVGYFEHWTQPKYKFTDFVKEEGWKIEKIDFSQKGYLEKYDVVFVEQNGFNDYIENDEPYIQDWVKRGGIFVIMHQSYERWAPYFFPRELGHTALIYRYVRTIDGFNCCADPSYTNDCTPYMEYMMPWIEDSGKRLFSEPENITPDMMLDWNIHVNTFGTSHFKEERNGNLVRTAAQCCFMSDSPWEIIGSFKDCVIKNGSLILKGAYGKGMYFLNQLLFPEILNDDAKRCLDFWKKYLKNLFAYFERFKNGEPENVPDIKKELPVKRNYKMSTHMHSLDWYGADSHPGTINAMMRFMNFDICSIAVKDNAPFDGFLDEMKYSDDKVLMLGGQEYHPFNWNDKYAHISHNTYHTLAVGIDADAYTTEFTCSLFSDEEIEDAVKKAIRHIHEHGGAAIATHPDAPHWADKGYDAVDMEPPRSPDGSEIEEYWLNGGKIAMTFSVDLYGFRRILDYPATNFIYLCGEKPCRDSVVKAIKKGHTIAACGFDEADIFIEDILPGDEISLSDIQKATLSVSAKIMKYEIKKLRVYEDDKIFYELNDINTKSIDLKIPLNGCNATKIIRVEIEGLNEHHICVSTPFYIK